MGKQKLQFFAAMALAALIAAPSYAFEMQFDWGDIALCTTGYPNVVDNPVFTLRDVPQRTKYIEFRLIDLDVPAYNHGGGVVRYDGQNKIVRGVFSYQSPCPPSGRHTYEWRATARESRSGPALGQAVSATQYP